MILLHAVSTELCQPLEMCSLVRPIVIHWSFSCHIRFWADLSDGFCTVWGIWAAPCYSHVTGKPVLWSLARIGITSACISLWSDQCFHYFLAILKVNINSFYQDTYADLYLTWSGKLRQLSSIAAHILDHKAHCMWLVVTKIYQTHLYGLVWVSTESVDVSYSRRKIQSDCLHTAWIHWLIWVSWVALVKRLFLPKIKLVFDNLRWLGTLGRLFAIFF